MAEDFVATIVDGERAEKWRQIFGGNTIYLKSLVPRRVDLPGEPNAMFYEVDVALLTAEQRGQLVDEMVARYQETAANRNEVERIVTLFDLDMDWLEGEQLGRLMDYVVGRLGRIATNRSQVERVLDIVGCPIPAEDVTVAALNPAEWLSN